MSAVSAIRSRIAVIPIHYAATDDRAEDSTEYRADAAATITRARTATITPWRALPRIGIDGRRRRTRDCRRRSLGRRSRFWPWCLRYRLSRGLRGLSCHAVLG